MAVTRFVTNVNSNGTVSVPAKLREAEGIEHGDQIVLLFEETIDPEGIVFEQEVKELVDL